VDKCEGNMSQEERAGYNSWWAVLRVSQGNPYEGKGHEAE
jgi:hypothetical protein